MCNLHKAAQHMTKLAHIPRSVSFFLLQGPLFIHAGWPNIGREMKSVIRVSLGATWTKVHVVVQLVGRCK